VVIFFRLVKVKDSSVSGAFLPYVIAFSPDLGYD